VVIGLEVLVVPIGSQVQGVQPCLEVLQVVQVPPSTSMETVPLSVLTVHSSEPSVAFLGPMVLLLEAVVLSLLEVLPPEVPSTT